MILAGAAALMMLVFGEPAEPGPGDVVVYAQLTVRQHTVVRVPRHGPPSGETGPTPVHWREGRGPRCVPARAVIGASLLGRNSVDLVLRDNRRIRARLDRGCPGLDFYSGFYIPGTEDGLICADRDSIRSRMGGQCEIDQFRSLTPITP